MYLEVVGFWGLLCLIMFFMAEWKNRNVTIGIIASFLLVLLGAWLMAEQIQIKTGESTLINSTIVTYPNGTVSSLPGSEQQTNTYTAAVGGFFNLNQTLGIVFMLLGAWAGHKYAMDMKSGW
jgi:hypothetical protein